MTGKTIALAVGGLLAGAAVAHARSRRSIAGRREWLEELASGADARIAAGPSGKALPGTYLSCQDSKTGAPRPHADCAEIITKFGDLITVPFLRLIQMKEFRL